MDSLGVKACSVCMGKRDKEFQMCSYGFEMLCAQNLAGMWWAFAVCSFRQWTWLHCVSLHRLCNKKT